MRRDGLKREAAAGPVHRPPLVRVQTFCTRWPADPAKGNELLKKPFSVKPPSIVQEAAPTI